MLPIYVTAASLKIKSPLLPSKRARVPSGKVALEAT